MSWLGYAVQAQDVYSAASLLGYDTVHNTFAAAPCTLAGGTTFSVPPSSYLGAVNYVSNTIVQGWTYSSSSTSGLALDQSLNMIVPIDVANTPVQPAFCVFYLGGPGPIC
jgi:hypothetical protein